MLLFPIWKKQSESQIKLFILLSLLIWTTQMLILSAQILLNSLLISILTLAVAKVKFKHMQPAQT